MPSFCTSSSERTARISPVILFALALAGYSPTAVPEVRDQLKQLGLPPVVVPIDNPQESSKVELGRALFNDTNLSSTGKISCASCHRSELAHSDGLAVSEGVQGKKGLRNAPSILNTAYLKSLFWEGRSRSLEDQVQEPFMHPAEHGLENKEALLKIIRGQLVYGRLFKQAFGIHETEISINHVAKALAAFERTLVAGNSPFDRYYYAGEKTALTDAAIRGLALFIGRAACANCHTIGVTSALFTDHGFHSLGVGLKRIENRLPEVVRAALNAQGKRVQDQSVTAADLAELGRFVVTKKPEDIGKFRTPSLRNVALTAPYMHDGSVPTLEAAVDVELYYRGVQSGRPLILTPEEKSDLVSFLRALTSPSLGATP